jgi:hypothetical protein
MRNLNLLLESSVGKEWLFAGDTARWDSQKTFNLKDTTHALFNGLARIPSMHNDSADDWLKPIERIQDNALIGAGKLQYVHF